MGQKITTETPVGFLPFFSFLSFFPRNKKWKTLTTTRKYSTYNGLRTTPSQTESGLLVTQSRTEMTPQTAKVVEVASILKKLAETGHQSHKGHHRLFPSVFWQKILWERVLPAQIHKRLRLVISKLTV